MTTLDDVKKFTLKTFTEPDGKLIPIEFNKDISFDVKRMFYVYDVHDQNDRGKLYPRYQGLQDQRQP